LQLAVRADSSGEVASCSFEHFLTPPVLIKFENRGPFCMMKDELVPKSVLQQRRAKAGDACGINGLMDGLESIGIATTLERQLA
jgi:hypothetical protein